MNPEVEIGRESPLERLIARAAGHSLWSDAAARCSRMEALLGPAMRAPSQLGPFELRRLATAVKARLGESDSVTLEQACDEIKALAPALDQAEQAELYCKLLRGLAPSDAFDTYPAEQLFSAAEIEAIDQLRARSPASRVRLPTLRWKPGADIDYGGYVCAIVKVTRQCNLRCSYCHDWRTGPEARMRFDVMLQVVRRLLSCEEHAIVDFVWHGGEPTLIGRREFLRILALQQAFKRPGQRVSNILQTNATGIDESWACFLSDLRFRASVSLDGPREIHDRSRPMASGRSSYDATRAGLAHLRKYGLASAILIVVGDEVITLGARRLLEFLHAEGFSKVALLPVRPDNPPTAASTPYLSLRRYARFLIDVHHERLACPEPRLSVRELDVLLDTRAGEMPKLCEHLGNCVGHYFSVEPNGDVSHCDKYLGDPEYKLGNVLEHGFEQLRTSAALLALRERTEQSRERMRTCEHFAKCRGWCPHERYVAKRTQLGVDPRCCGLGPIFDELDALERTKAAS